MLTKRANRNKDVSTGTLAHSDAGPMDVAAKALPVPSISSMFAQVTNGDLVLEFRLNAPYFFIAWIFSLRDSPR